MKTHMKTHVKRHMKTIAASSFIVLYLAAALLTFRDWLTAGIVSAIAGTLFGIVWVWKDQCELRAVSAETERAHEELRVEAIEVQELALARLGDASPELRHEVASLLTYGAALLMGPPFTRISYPSGYLLQQHKDGLLLIAKARALVEQRLVDT